MKVVRLKESGGHINVLEDNDSPVDGELNFTSKEWAWALKIGRDPTDPVKEKEFFRALFDKKAANKDYSLFNDFPDSEHREMSMAERYCSQIKEQILHGKKESA